MGIPPVVEVAPVLDPEDPELVDEAVEAPPEEAEVPADPLGLPEGTSSKHAGTHRSAAREKTAFARGESVSMGTRITQRHLRAGA